jgi:hypothetical protein
MTPEQTATLTSIFGKPMVDAGTMLEAAYGPAVARMATKEIINLWNLANAKQFAAAKASIRSKMSQQELADEASHLAELTFDSAVENAKGWNLLNELLVGALKVLIALALGAAGL